MKINREARVKLLCMSLTDSTSMSLWRAMSCDIANHNMPRGNPFLIKKTNKIKE